MDDKREENEPQRMIEAWLRTATDFWTAALKPWSEPAAPGPAADAKAGPDAKPGPKVKPGASETGRTQEALAAIQKSWRTLSSAMEEPQTLQSLFAGIGTMPEVVLRLAQTGWAGFLNLQGQWLEKAVRLGQTTTAYNFDNLDAEAFHVWSDIYEKEFRQLLNIPQLGLARGYQERLNQAMDKFNRLQAAMAEFLYLLYMPVEKATKVMQDELDLRTREGGLPESPKDYYNMWIKTLEGHYMTLFKSSEYTQALGKTLDAMGDYMVARKGIVEDVLKTLPVPTHTEVDELYREIYLLKKRIKRLEKKSGNG